MELKLCYLFSKQMNLYGDRGNIIALRERCERRGIKIEIAKAESAEEARREMAASDIFFVGGGSDREQAIIEKEFLALKKEFKAAIEDGVAGLAICGGYQLLGHYYQTLDGKKIEAAGALDLYTASSEERLVGNALIMSDAFGKVAGFENHAGRTHHAYKPLGSVVKGRGNNGEDGKEGLIYKNLVGTYLHGPILPKNPKICDYLISRALERKYGEAALAPLDDRLEDEARERVWQTRT